MSESIRENKSPLNQVARKLLEPEESLNPNKVHLLQLAEWGLEDLQPSEDLFQEKEVLYGAIQELDLATPADVMNVLEGREVDGSVTLVSADLAGQSQRVASRVVLNQLLNLIES